MGIKSGKGGVAVQSKEAVFGGATGAGSEYGVGCACLGSVEALTFALNQGYHCGCAIGYSASSVTNRPASNKVYME